MEQETPLKYIAGLSETKGEHVTRALRNVFDKMCQLEKEKKEARQESDLTHSRKEATAQSLKDAQVTHAAAEARCKLLELQLHHIRTLLGKSSGGVIWDDTQTETKTISTATDTYQSKSRIRKTVSKTSQGDNRNLKSRETIPSREITINQQTLNSSPLPNNEQFSSVEKGRTSSFSEDNFRAHNVNIPSSAQYYPSAPPLPDDMETTELPHNIRVLHNSEQRNSSFPNNLHDTLEKDPTCSSNHSRQLSGVIMPDTVSEGLFDRSGSTSKLTPTLSGEFNQIVSNTEGPHYNRSLSNDSGQQSVYRMPEISSNLSSRVSENPMIRTMCNSGHITNATTTTSGYNPSHVTTSQFTSGTTTGQYSANITSPTSISFMGTSEELPSCSHSGQQTTEATRTSSSFRGTSGNLLPSQHAYGVQDVGDAIAVNANCGLEERTRREMHRHSGEQNVETSRPKSFSKEETQPRKSLYGSSELHTTEILPMVSTNLTDTIEEGPLTSRSSVNVSQRISEDRPRFSNIPGSSLEEGPLSSRSIFDKSSAQKDRDGTIYHTKNEIIKSYEHKKLSADSQQVTLEQQEKPSATLQNQDSIYQTVPKVVDKGDPRPTSRSKSRSRPTSKSRSVSKKRAPFILGKSTGDSHSVPANMQNVRNILKNGSGKLRSPSRQSSVASKQEKCARSSSANTNGIGMRYSSDIGSTREDIKEVICQLEEEKAILLQEIYRCEKLLNGAAHPSLVQSMTPELNSLKQRLKAKSLQIDRLDTLLGMIGSPSKCPQFHSQTATLAKDKPGHLFVTTEITTRPSGKSIEVQTTMTKVSKTPERTRKSEIDSNRQFLHELRDIKHSLQESNR